MINCSEANYGIRDPCDENDEEIEPGRYTLSFVVLVPDRDGSSVTITIDVPRKAPLGLIIVQELFEYIVDGQLAVRIVGLTRD